MTFDSGPCAPVLDDVLSASGFNDAAYNNLFAAAQASFNHDGKPTAWTRVKLSWQIRRMPAGPNGLTKLAAIFGDRFNRGGELKNWQLKPYRRFPRRLWSAYDLAIHITIKTPIRS